MKDSPREMPGATGVIDIAAYVQALQEIGKVPLHRLARFPRFPGSDFTNALIEIALQETHRGPGGELTLPQANAPIQDRSTDQNGKPRAFQDRCAS